MKVHQERLEVRTDGRSFANVTVRVAEVVNKSGVQTGVCNIFILHTSASLVIQENADPAVLEDLNDWIAGLAPESRRWRHTDEGPDDMPSHARSAVTKTSETVPISQGRLALGTWQAIYIWEHRARSHARHLFVTVIGDSA